LRAGHFRLLWILGKVATFSALRARTHIDIAFPNNKHTNTQVIFFTNKKNTRADAGKRLSMDAQTIKSLELVANRRTGSKLGSLLQILDVTKTCVGARFLRGQLISPLSDLDQIELRLTAVSEMAENPDCRNLVQNDLARFPDLDRIATRFAVLPKRFDVRELRAEIEAVRGLRQAISQVKYFNMCKIAN